MVIKKSTISLKQHSLLIFITFIIVSLLMISSVFVGIPFHNIQTTIFQNQVVEQEIASSYVLETHEEFGIIWGSSNHCDYQLLVAYKSDLENIEFDKEITKIGDALKPSIGPSVNINIYVYKNNQILLYYDENLLTIEKNQDGMGYYAENHTQDFYLESWEYRQLATLFENSEADYIVTYNSQSFDDIDVKTDYRCG